MHLEKKHYCVHAKGQHFELRITEMLVSLLTYLTFR